MKSRFTDIFDGIKEELGVLSLSFDYDLENEAYRMLPRILLDHYGIELKEKLIRAEIGGKEINILGRATKNGKAVVLVGEVKARLDERRRKGEKDLFDELEEKVQAARKEGYVEGEIVRVFVTHFVTKGLLKKAQERGVIVIQSFEW